MLRTSKTWLQLRLDAVAGFYEIFIVPAQKTGLVELAYVLNTNERDPCHFSLHRESYLQQAKGNRRRRRHLRRKRNENLCARLNFSRLPALHKSSGFAEVALSASVRLYWGWQLMQSGWGKLHNIGGVTEFFSSLGLPAPHFTAIAISNLELFGGALLALGLGSRLIGLVLSVNMLMAYITADREGLMSVFSDPGKFYNADPFTFLMASLLVFIFGAGIFSLDSLIQLKASARKSSFQQNVTVEPTAA